MTVEEFLLFQYYWIAIPIISLAVLLLLVELFYFLYHFIEDKEYKACLLNKIISTTGTNLGTDMAAFYAGTIMLSVATILPVVGIIFPTILILGFCILGIRSYRRKIKELQK